MLATAKRIAGVRSDCANPGTEPAPHRGSAFTLSDRVRGGIDVIDLACRAILMVLLTGELLMILTEIVRRHFIDQSFLWSEEVSRLILLTLAFVGGPLAYRAQSHASVAFVVGKLPPRAKSIVAAGTDVLILGVGAITLSAAMDLFQIDMLSILPITQWNLGVIVVPIQIGMALTILFSVERLAFEHRPTAVLAAIAAITAAGVLVYAVSAMPALRPGPGWAMLIMIVAFFAVILLGVPVAFAMLVGTIFYLGLTDAAPMIAVAQNTVDGAGLFILLTIPFFVWAGLIMERGGISVRLVRFAMAMVGHFRGGLLQVVILTTFLVSGVSGSKLADVVAVGSVMREQLLRRGYKTAEAAGVLAAATAMSETIPPSIAMLVLGSVVPVSIGDMFVSGIIPAVALAIILMLIVWLKAVRGSTAMLERAPAMERLDAAIGAVLPAAMPAILIVGIKGGYATPTEVSSVAVFYGLVLAVLVYRQLNWRDFIRITIESAVMSGMILFMVAAAGSFAWILSAGNMPSYLVAALHLVGDNKYVFLTGSILILIVVGSLLEGIPSLIILAPVLYPLAVKLGIDGVHYAIVLLLAMGVGIFVPPLGIGFFVACSVMKTTVEETSREVIAYMLALIAGILLLAFVPWFSVAVLGARH